MIRPHPRPLAPTLLLLAATAGVPAILPLGALLSAADAVPGLLWSATAPAGQPPADWTWSKSALPDSTLAFADDQLVLSGEPGAWSTVQRNLIGFAGTDDQPLVVSCAIAAEGRGTLTALPALLALRWSDRDLVAVGLSDSGEHRGDGAVSWSGWAVDGKRGDSRGQVEPYTRESPLLVRVVVTGKVVITQASRDGFEWRTVATVERRGALSGPPTAIVLGHGWLKADAADGKLTDEPAAPKSAKDKDGKGQPPVWRFSDLRAVKVGADLPSSLTSTYQRKESGDDTRDALYDAGFPVDWQLAGPFTSGEDPLGGGVRNDAPGMTWKALATGGKASERFLQLDDQLPGLGGQAVRYARFTIACDQPRAERFLFDGLRDTTLIVNGRRIATARSADDRKVTLDRLGAVAWLKAGDNTILVRVTASPNKGDSRLVLRHEPGDPRWRAAVSKRLLTDFPPDSSLLASERMEIGRDWEAAGNLKAAAAAYAEAAAGEDAPIDTVIEALTARTRAHAALRDDQAQAADVTELGKAWAEDGTDAVGAALRGARLHSLLGRDDLAVATLDQALAKATTTDDRLTIAGERMRLRRALGQDAKLAEELTAVAGALPADDPRKVPLLATAAQAAVYQAPGSQPSGKKADLTAVVAAAKASARPADLHLAALSCQVAGDLAGAAALAKQMVGVVSDADPLLVFAAELAGDPQVTLPALRRHLAALGQPAPDAAPLADLRLRVLRAELCSTPDGQRLMTEVDGLKLAPQDTQITPNQRTWKGIGPFANDNWKRYDQPPVDPGNPDFGKASEGRAWKDVPADPNGAIDIAGVGLGADNSVAVFTTELNAAAAGTSLLTCGADDGLTVWLNGEKVYEDRTQRGVVPDSIPVQLKLKAGRNRLTLMIQNGNGGFGFQARLREGPYPATDLARILAFAAQPANQDKRDAVAAALLSLLGELERSTRPESTALAAATLRAFPDQLPRTFEAASSVYYVCDGYYYNNGWAPWAVLPEALAWLDRARLAGLAPDRQDIWHQLPYFGGNRLRQASRFEAANRLLLNGLLTDPDAGAQARTLLQLAAFYRFTGAARAALPLFMRVADDPALNPDDAKWAREQVTLLRRKNGDLVRIEAPFEATAASGAIERLAAAKDVEGLVATAQKLFDSGAGATLPGAQGIGSSGWLRAVEALRSLGAPGAEAYRAKYQLRAEAALRSAARDADAVACERVAMRWPLCTTRGLALLRAAELYRDAGDLALARSTAGLAQGELDDAELKARAKALAALATPAAAAAAEVAALRVAFPIPAADAADLARFSSRQVACLPALANGVLVLHNGDTAWGVDAATGAQRWRLAGTPGNTERFAGLPSWQTSASADGVVALRLRGEDLRLAVVRVDPRDGTPLWTSSTVPELAGLTAVSSPTATPSRVVAAFADAEGARRLVALAADDGRLLWSTPLPGQAPEVPCFDQLAMRLSDHAAPPMVLGRELYWCSDTGVVVRLDAASGTLLWAAPYPRAVLDLNEGQSAISALIARGVSRVVLAGDRLLVAPRDSMGLLALDRATGLRRWSRPVTEIRELAPVATGGARPLVIAQSRGLEAIDPQDGGTAWLLADTATRGTALVEGGALFAAGDAAVLRIDPAGGKVLARVPWGPADLQAGLGTLVRAGRNVLAVGDGQLATVGAAAAKPVVLGDTVGSPLVLTGLPLQADGTMLGIVARWTGGAVRQVLVAPGSGERYVRTDAWLARIEGGAQPRLAWQMPLDGETRALALTAKTVFCIQSGAVTIYDRATGVRQGTVGTAPQPQLAFGSDYKVTASDEAITCYNFNLTTVDVLDPQSGVRLVRHEFGRGVAGATVRGGQLLVVRDGDGGVQLEVRDARSAAPGQSQKLPFDNVWDLKVITLDADHWLIGKGERALLLDLRTRALEPLENRWHLNNPWVVSATTVGDGWALSRENWEKGFAQVWDGQRKQILAVEGAKVLPAYFKDRAVLMRNENNKLALVAIEYGSGKQLWKLESENRWDRFYKLLVPMGERTVSLSQKRDGTQRYHLIAPDGKLLGENALPGMSGVPLAKDAQSQDAVVSATADQLWLGTAQGLVILAACTPEAAKAQATGGDLPVAERVLRDLNARGSGPSLDSAQGTVQIDGDLGEWPDEPLREATPADHRIPALAGAARIGAVRLRSTFDAQQVAFAVEVTEPSGAPLTLRLGLDVRGEDNQRLPTPILEIANRDGATTIHLAGGSWTPGTDLNGLEPSARAVRTLDGWRFEIGLPWALLRDRPEWRPGDRRWMRYDLLVAAPGDAVEFGQGLANGVDWTLWPGLHFMEEAGKKPGKKSRHSQQGIGNENK